MKAMLQHIVKIIWNERNANFLIWLELLVVSVCLLYLSDFAVTKAWTYTRPMGIDTHNVVNFTFDELWAGHPKYVSPDVDSTSTYEAITRILRRIEQHPDVEAICYCFSGFPYHGNKQIATVTNKGNNGTTLLANLLVVSPSYLDVFHLKNATGTEAELKDILANGVIIPSESVAKEFGFSTKEFLNQELTMDVYGDSATSTVKCVMKNIRRNEIDELEPMVLRYDEKTLRDLLMERPWSLQFGLRLKANSTITARKLFNELRPQLQVANWHVEDMTPIEDMKEQSQAAFFNSLKLNAIYMSFLLICIFLGVIGTFWYRTQQRRAQMGLRLAMGETPSRLLHMYLTEGLLLVVGTLPISVVAYYFLSTYQILDDDAVSFFWRAPLTFVVTYAILALLTLFAIWIPTRSAVHIPPSLSMHEE